MAPRIKIKGTRFLRRRFSFTSDSTSTFNPSVLKVSLSGDIHPLPGPVRQKKEKRNKHDKRNRSSCTECGRTAAKNHHATYCDGCLHWTHIKCEGMKPTEYEKLKFTGNLSRTCKACFEVLQELPFINTSLNSESDSEG